MEADELKTTVDKAVEPVMTAFEEFKATNDARLKEIEKKGAADPILTDKLAKIETTLAAFEGVNQKLTLLDAQKKSVDELQKQYDAIETKLGRMIGKKSAAVEADEYKSRINSWARAVVDAHTVGVVNLSAEQQKALTDAQNEAKSLGLTPDTAAGYLAPTEYVREIIKGVTEISPARSLVRVRATANKSIQIPKRTGQFAAAWVADEGTKTETTGLTYGLEELPAHELYALVDISNGMLEDSAFDLESEIRLEAAEQFALAEGTAVVSGNGVGRPEGFLTNSSVSTTNSGAATTITADGLLSLFYAVKTAYSREASWVLNRTTLGSARKLKDGNGQYLWMPGLASGVPNTINGAPYVEFPDMPNEGAGLKPVAFGAFARAYLLVDRIAMEMLRDPYTQATSGRIRFIFRRRLGGKVVLPEAIRVLVCST